MMTVRFTLLILFAIVIMLGAAGRALAQEDDSEEKVLSVYLEELARDLDQLSQDLADEYLDILEQLGEVIEDYTDYLEDLDEAAQKEHTVSVTRISRNLESSAYIDSQEQLLEDIYDLIDETKHLEARHKVASNARQPQCCRVARNFRRDLVIIADLVEDLGTRQTVRVLKRDDIKLYLNESLKELIKALQQEQDLKGRVLELEIPGVPPVPPAPPIPSPSPKTDSKEWQLLKDLYRDKKGLVHQYESSAAVSKRDLPILINNSTGGVLITGWAEDLVVARLEVEVLAASRAKEKELLDLTRLEIRSERDGYHVQADYPEISDPESMFLRANLIVNVPAQNPVKCENSFGQVAISALLNGVDLRSANSSVELDNIRGAVKVLNSMGPTVLSDVVGSARIRSSYGGIEVYGCDGDLDIENTYALVKLSDTRGPASIRNLGQITVDNHIGDLTIKNDYGKVEVRGVDGRVVVSNSYQPMIVREVSGATELENAYSGINVYQIDDSLTVVNHSGTINAEMLQGPITLTSVDGNIIVMLEEELAGESSINASHGSISVTLSDRTNLLVRAHTTEGRITCSFPIEVTDQGSSKLAELKFGRGVNILALSGKHADIVIDRQN